MITRLLAELGNDPEAYDVRTSLSPLESTRTSDIVQHPCLGKRAARARVAVVEGDIGCVEGLARAQAANRRS
jgi:hypothetical protein